MNHTQPPPRQSDILIVDDTLPNLQVLFQILDEEGYKVRGVPNGEMALMVIHHSPPELILLDINMPGMNGYQVCQQLKADEQTCDIPVLFISALDEEWDKVKAFDVGGVDYITKPFQVKEVLARVKNQLRLLHLQQDLQQANRALSEANASLKASNMELDAFAQTVSHNLKSPLATIQIVSNLLLEENASRELFDPIALQLLQGLKQTGSRASHIIEELLLLATIRKKEVKREPLDMGFVISSVEINLAHQLAEHQPELILPADWPMALGYMPWLKEVWTNLISNGLKYGGRPPRLEFGATNQANGMIRFWIRDNGPGIPEEDQETIFTEFTRLATTQAEGHGLGLSIVKRIINKLGGEVGVESEVGQGALFYFLLPRAESD